MVKLDRGKQNVWSTVFCTEGYPSVLQSMASSAVFPNLCKGRCFHYVPPSLYC
nr:MAG TPA: hypothetical protein [Caudoviricetes sp.]